MFMGAREEQERKYKKYNKIKDQNERTRHQNRIIKIKLMIEHNSFGGT